MEKLEDKKASVEPQMSTPNPEEVQSEKAKERETLTAKVQDFLKGGGKIKKQTPAGGRKRTAKPKKDSIAKKAKGNATGSTGGQTAWATLGVKKGTRLEWVGKSKPTGKVHAIVDNAGSMQTKLYVDGKAITPPKPFGLDGETFDGVVALEVWVRAKVIKEPRAIAKLADAMAEFKEFNKVKNDRIALKRLKLKYINKSKGVFSCKMADGWDVWAIPKGKGFKTVHQLYSK